MLCFLVDSSQIWALHFSWPFQLWGLTCNLEASRMARHRFAAWAPSQTLRSCSKVFFFSLHFWTLAGRWENASHPGQALLNECSYSRGPLLFNRFILQIQSLPGVLWWTTNVSLLISYIFLLWTLSYVPGEAKTFFWFLAKGLCDGSNNSRCRSAYSPKGTHLAPSIDIWSKIGAASGVTYDNSSRRVAIWYAILNSENRLTNSFLLLSSRSL